MASGPNSNNAEKRNGGGQNQNPNSVLSSGDSTRLPGQCVIVVVLVLFGEFVNCPIVAEWQRNSQSQCQPCLCLRPRVVEGNSCEPVCSGGPRYVDIPPLTECI